MPNNDSAPNDPELYFAEDGAPRSARFGDIYYSLQDGLSEARAVFLSGCHLPQAWQDRDDFTVLELGFGTGLNIIALMQMWADHRQAAGHLHVFSVEGFLMPREDAARALAAWPELELFASAVLAQWPKARRGFHHMDFPQWGVTVTLALMEVEVALDAWDGQADAVFLDGFSPALNPGMWSEAVFNRVAAHCAEGARLATFTVAGFVRRGLSDAGFAVSKCPGFGRKRERLEAVFTAGHARSRRRPRRIAVIGAGIAGCALAHQARLFGLSVDLFDMQGVGAGASGNLAALVTPRLDAGDNAISALFADAYAYAGALYRHLCPGAIIGEGLDQYANGPRDVSRFARISRQAGFPAGELTVFGDAGADLSDQGGIRLHSALWLRPKDALEALRNGLSPAIAGWPDARFDAYDVVILACGEGIFDILTHHALQPVRGQVEFAAGIEAPERALSWGGYAVPLNDGLVFGATHDRDDRGREVRAVDQTRNIDNLARVMPACAEAIDPAALKSRASIRVMTRDYLPAMGEVAPGLYALTGLGARGFCLAPLLARALLADICGWPSPLPVAAKKILNITRLIADQPA